MNEKLEKVNRTKARMRDSIVRTLEQKVATATLYGMADVIDALEACLARLRGGAA